MCVFFFKQKTAYEMRISDWSSDVCSSDLRWLFDHAEQARVTPGVIHALSDRRLARAIVAIHGEPGRAWALDELAAEAGMSRAGLTSAFRRHMGRSVGDYLSDYRVLVAKRELSLGRPVALVSDELGYASPTAFARMFNARAGQTPREWAARASAPDND